VARVKREVEEIIGLDCSDAIECSAKKVPTLISFSRHDISLSVTPHPLLPKPMTLGQG